MKTRSRRISLVFVLLTLVGAPAAADPITVAYDVEIFSRFSRSRPGIGTVEPFSQQFTLSMTFDPALGPAGGVYGPPTFSPVPLDVPPPPDDFSLSSSGFTTHVALAAGGVHASAYGIVGGTGTVNGNLSVYVRTLRLISTVLASNPPLPVTPETFPAHLVLVKGQSPVNFSYGICLGIGPFPPSADACNDASGAGSREVAYFGSATLRQVDQAPVPEPATFVLVGSSLAILARYRRRLRSASSRT